MEIVRKAETRINIDNKNKRPRWNGEIPKMCRLNPMTRVTIYVQKDK
jgi:hypothetical protein